MNIKRFFKDRISDFMFIYRKSIKSDLLKRKDYRILMYHSIERSDLKEDNMGLAVPPETFYMHMKYLKENDFHVTGLLDFAEKVINNSPIKERSVIITFDDGFKSVLTNALPVLTQFNFTATLFVNIYFVEHKLPPDLYYCKWQVLNWDESKTMKGQGISIGSHSLTHKRLTLLTDRELSDEVIQSKRLIEDNINERIYSFSYPHGAFDNRVKEILNNNNFKCSCSSIEGTNSIKSDLFALKRTEITAFDDTALKFEKKLLGCCDWLGSARFHD